MLIAAAPDDRRPERPQDLCCLVSESLGFLAKALDLVVRKSLVTERYCVQFRSGLDQGVFGIGGIPSFELRRFEVDLTFGIQNDLF